MNVAIFQDFMTVVLLDGTFLLLGQIGYSLFKKSTNDNHGMQSISYLEFMHVWQGSATNINYFM